MGTLSASSTLQLPLHSRHVALGARLGHFGDWEVPLYYTTILEEHEAVRSKAGLFEISHMGKFHLEGPSVVTFLEKLLPRPIASMKFLQALYMPLLNERGGFVDDIIVYRVSETRFFIIVNAGNLEKDRQWIVSRLNGGSGVKFQDLSSDHGLLALQGPLAAMILDKAFPDAATSDLRYYTFKEWRGGLIARTGYTGEDGFEIMVPKTFLPELWDKIMEAGKVLGILPVGFGARDTLRLEAGMPLYGHDMNDDFTPLETGFHWAVDLNKEAFVGLNALKTQKEAGLNRCLVGFEMLGRGIPRQDYEVAINGTVCGKVTSGSFAPTLKKNIGMAYVPVKYAAPGTEIDIMIRSQASKAIVIKLPFYKRKK